MNEELTAEQATPYRSLVGPAIIWYLIGFGGFLFYTVTQEVRFLTRGGIPLVITLAAMDALFVLASFFLTALFIDRGKVLPRLIVPVVVIAIGLALAIAFHVAFPAVDEWIIAFFLRP